MKNQVRMLKNNKVAGVNYINGEILKACGLLMDWLNHLVCVKAAFVSAIRRMT